MFVFSLQKPFFISKSLSSMWNKHGRPMGNSILCVCACVPPSFFSCCVFWLFYWGSVCLDYFAMEPMLVCSLLFQHWGSLALIRGWNLQKVNGRVMILTTLCLALCQVNLQNVEPLHLSPKAVHDIRLDLRYPCYKVDQIECMLCNSQAHILEPSKDHGGQISSF